MGSNPSGSTNFNFRDWTDEHRAWSNEFHISVCSIEMGILTHVICDGRDHYKPEFPTHCEKLAIEEVKFQRGRIPTAEEVGLNPIQ